ncbi:MAG: hypothetical protein GY716_10740 [bacterium]|nr:hypothetical protein [bacterium]
MEHQNARVEPNPDDPATRRRRRSSGRRRRRRRKSGGRRSLRGIYFGLAALWGFLIGSGAIVAALVLAGQQVRSSPTLAGVLAGGSLLAVGGGGIAARAYREASGR